MKYALPLLLMFIFCGCKNTYTFDTLEIPPESREAAQKWILSCIEKANPYSDEEPEHMTAQCERTGKRLFGVRVRVTEQCINQRCYRIKVEPGTEVK